VNRRRLVSGITATGVAVALVFGLSGISGTSGTAPRAETAAFVISRAAHAMGDLMLHAQVAEPGLGVFKIWAYHGREMEEQFVGGHLSAVNWSRSTARKTSWVSVEYSSRDWDRQNGPAWPSSGCEHDQPPLFYGVVPGMVPADFPGYVRASLACGAYAMAGRARIDGVATVRLDYTGTFFGPVQPTFRVKHARYHYILYVNASTYLPVRLAQWGPEKVTGFVPDEDFQWLPATKANLALLNVRIPPGFHQITV
jgi:hypothetical protein